MTTTCINIMYELINYHNNIVIIHVVIQLINGLVDTFLKTTIPHGKAACCALLDEDGAFLERGCETLQVFFKNFATRKFTIFQVLGYKGMRF